MCLCSWKRSLAVALIVALMAQSAQAGMFSGAAKRLGLGLGITAGLATWVAYCKAHPNGEYEEDGPSKRKVPCISLHVPSAVGDPAVEGAAIARTKEEDSDKERVRRQNAAELRRNLLDEQMGSGGPPEPPEDCDAHHIVPQLDERDGLKQYADEARQAIAGCVDINDAQNGVFLPRSRQGSGCQGSYHRTLHNRTYYQTLVRDLGSARKNAGCDGVREALNEIKQQLMSGKL